MNFETDKTKDNTEQIRHLVVLREQRNGRTGTSRETWAVQRFSRYGFLSDQTTATSWFWTQKPAFSVGKSCRLTFTMSEMLDYVHSMSHEAVLWRLRLF